MIKSLSVVAATIIFLSCGSSANNSDSVEYVNLSKYKLSVGADTLFTSYNRLATGNGCYDSNAKEPLWVTTMPVYCYLVSDHLGNNRDTPITVGIQYVYHDPGKPDTNAFQSIWSSHGWQTWGNCQPEHVFYPIDTIPGTGTTSDGGINTWFVEQTAYRDIVKKINSILARNTDTLFNAGLICLPAKNITRLSNWGIEDTNGFCATKLPTFYNNLFCASGVTVTVNLKLNGRDTAMNCYLVIDDDAATMRWKDSVINVVAKQ